MSWFNRSTSAVRQRSRLQQKFIENRPHSLALKKGGAVLVCASLAYLLYLNWDNVLNTLDKGPIRAYALTHKTQFTTNTDIRHLLAREPSLKGYFGQNIREIEDRFLSIPWVKDVAVRKIYPDRLSITLLEYQPVAVWRNNDNQQKEQRKTPAGHIDYLSAKGKIFSLPEDRFQAKKLPVLSGPDNQSQAVLSAWGKIQSDLNSRHLGLYSVEMSNRGSWTITLDNGVELRLGRGEWLPKIDRFVSLFPALEIPQGKRLAYVDLRYEHGVAIGFRHQ